MKMVEPKNNKTDLSRANNNKTYPGWVLFAVCVCVCDVCAPNNIVLVYLFILCQIGASFKKKSPSHQLMYQTLIKFVAGFECLPRCEWNADDNRYFWGPNAQSKYLSGTKIFNWFIFLVLFSFQVRRIYC